MRTTILAVACLAALSTPAVAFKFGAPVVQTGNAAGLAIGDVNGDQLDDLVAGDAIYLQQPNGALASPQHFPFPYPTYFGTHRALVDLNRDGTLDVATCSDGGVQLLFANATNGFTAVQVPVAASAGRTWTCQGIAALDINQDGNPDLVALNSVDDQLLFFLGDGHGHVSGTTTMTLPQKAYRDVQAGDVTSDGIADVVLAGEGVDLYPVKPGGGLGSGTTSNRFSSSSLQESAAIGDMDGDGRNDVVATEYGSSVFDWYTQTDIGALPTIPIVNQTGALPFKAVVTDLDHDGWSDLVIGHDTALGRFMGPYNGMGWESMAGGTFRTQGVELAAGDLNDDGCSDAAIDGDSATNIFIGADCVPGKAVADFDGDGRSDIFWRNAQTGGNAIWKSANSTTAQVVTAVTNLAWTIFGTGDFNGDGRADVLWHNASDGSSAIWLSGNPAMMQSLVRVTDLAWEIVGVGDFNGDGKDDVLWRNRTTGANAIWLGANASTLQTVATVSSAYWKVAGVDDFDGDGRSDILWRNEVSGANAIWASASSAASRAITAVTDLHWRVAGTGDFDGDGKADILWRNASTGSNVIWRAATSATPMRVAPVSGNWSIVIGDFNGDRKADILWRSQATGVNGAWRAGQSTVQLAVTDIADTAWCAVP